jgi:hypothetical protein
VITKPTSHGIACGAYFSPPRIANFVAGRGGRVRNPPMRSHRLAGPYRACLTRRVVANGENEIELWPIRACECSAPWPGRRSAFTSSRRSCPVIPLNTAMRSSERSVSAIASRSRRSSQRRVSSHSVKTIRRRSVHDEPSSRLALIHLTSYCTRTSAFDAALSASASMSSTAASSRPRSAVEAQVPPATEAASAAVSSSASTAVALVSSGSSSSIASVFQTRPIARRP